MKYLFLIAFVWFLFFESCNKETPCEQEVPEKTTLAQPLKATQNLLDKTYDSLSTELCCRVYLSEQQLNALKKKRWPNSETLMIIPMRSIDPVYCNTKSNNPPE